MNAHDRTDLEAAYTATATATATTAVTSRWRPLLLGFLGATGGVLVWLLVAWIYVHLSHGEQAYQFILQVQQQNQAAQAQQAKPPAPPPQR